MTPPLLPSLLAPSTAPAWHVVSRLGEAQILLPAMAVALVWLLRRPDSRPLALAWLAATALAATLTTATKLAFIGWELGYAPLDFTGISGHAMFAAAILPPLLFVAEGSLPPRWRSARWSLGWSLGLVLAGLIAVSRVKIGAHSWSEVAAGFALGTTASAAARAFGHLPRLDLTRWLAPALLAGALLGIWQAPPSRTHDWVTRLALASSGRAHPYQRWQMHRDALPPSLRAPQRGLRWPRSSLQTR